MSSAIGIVVSVVVIVAAGGILVLGLGGFKHAPKWLQNIYARIGNTFSGYSNLTSGRHDSDRCSSAMRYVPETGTYVSRRQEMMTETRRDNRRSEVLPMYQRQDGQQFGPSQQPISPPPNAYVRDSDRRVSHHEQLPAYSPRAGSPKPPSVRVETV